MFRLWTIISWLFCVKNKCFVCNDAGIDHSGCCIYKKQCALASIYEKQTRSIYMYNIYAAHFTVNYLTFRIYIVIPPATEVWRVYINHPVFLSVRPSVRLSLQSKLNFEYNFCNKPEKASVLHIWVPKDKTFLSVPKIWPRDLDFWPSFEENLTLAITFEQKQTGLSYFMYIFLVFFDLVTLTLTLTYFWKKKTLPWPESLNEIRLSRSIHITHVYSSWNDLCVGTIIFQLMTLTLTFFTTLRNWKCITNIISSQVYKSWGWGY